MKIISKPLKDVLVLEPKVFGDARGFFLESYNERVMADVGIRAHFVQDNQSLSARNVVRGLHYQVRQVQGKLVRVIVGEILDVIVDLRQSSSTYGQWSTVPLSGENKHMLWIPPGLAHGFRVVSDSAHVLYKATDYYLPEAERTVSWSDPDLKIDWQLSGDPIVSEKDQHGTSFHDAEKFE
jgi:dTDP-4-dehydrorhamnose 3,5-epimerase